LRPKRNIEVEVSVALDSIKGIAKWYFETIDPTTNDLPSDPDMGFLQPNDSTGRGQGCVSFAIDLNESVTNESEVKNRATIVFDYNKPIMTPTWSNKKDNVAPTSSMNQAILASDTTTIISWQGKDNKGGSGVYCYNVFVKKGTGVYTPLLTRTTQTAVAFEFEKAVEYAFYVTAVDSAENKEAKVKVPDITFYNNSVGVKDLSISYKGEMIVYPNPSKSGNDIHIEFTYPEESLRNGRLVITTMTGSVVKMMNKLEKGMTINGLGRGAFIVDLIIDQKDVKCEKIIVE
jgi:hypothetical protein